MSATHAVLPGSFDPPTRGHLDLVRRALSMFPRLTLLVGAHHAKSALFSPEERVELLRRCTAELPGVEVAQLDGLLVDGCAKLGAQVVVRGVRNGSDLDYEMGMAHTNAELAPGLETVFLAPAPDCAHVSSSLVRQIAGLGGDVSSFVPPAVAEALSARAQS